MIPPSTTAAADSPPPPDAGAIAEIPCTVKAIKQARKAADAHVNAGDPQAAVALLSSVGCIIEPWLEKPLIEQLAWTASDLAFAYYKAGNPWSCYATAAAHLEPGKHNAVSNVENERVVQALRYNTALCRKAAETKRGAFTPATTCVVDPRGHGIPAGVLPGGDACLVVAEPTQDADDLLVCGGVTLVQGKTRTPLVVERGNLADASVCCNVSTMRFASRPGGWAVLVASQGTDCNGGTAASSEEHVYELRDGKLVLVHQLDATSN